MWQALKKWVQVRSPTVFDTSKKIYDLRQVKCCLHLSCMGKVSKKISDLRTATESGLLPSPPLLFYQDSVGFLKFPADNTFMANDQEVQMPSSQGGLVQYFDSDTGFEIDPKTVIMFSIGVAAVTLSLHVGII